MFAIPQATTTNDEGAQPREGECFDCPIVLEGYKSIDFERLLLLLYPSGISGDPVALNTKEEWISVLRLATVWEMGQIRDLAISKLTLASMTPAERIRLSREYRVASWFTRGVKELADSPLFPGATPIDEIASEIGWETTARIMALISSHQMATGEKILPTTGSVKVPLTSIFCRRSECGRTPADKRSCPLNHKDLRVSATTTSSALAPPQAPSLFGTSSTTRQPAQSSTFGMSATATNQPASSSLFGATTTVSQSSFMGSTNPAPLFTFGGGSSSIKTAAGQNFPPKQTKNEDTGSRECEIHWSSLKSQIPGQVRRSIPDSTVEAMFANELKALR
ncbi:hypothetical protein CC1G_11814 [Coprinopsis cinerea okayama7|uniref:BTB domain-containing protein n=1 Tax=Coprinopsis cinerea (strain Okayama-7 / 130 / ATCC MYA-4618 / FGSC 9003) TaxID=240176 RepID=A8N821_COPC7|nr:hypothetical protein CC1G_11814 [Coprinopsis cinerea okayama7\|eukprot:XP_001830977.2 hypothetical protein CC1G_11814 [Coprinopsis cinerea okayama7\